MSSHSALPLLLGQSGLRHHHVHHGRAGRGQRRAGQPAAEDEDAPRRPAGLRHRPAALLAVPLPGHCVRSGQHHRHIRECPAQRWPVGFC